MQLGTRWALGATVPAGLPDVVEIALQAVEGDLAAVEADTSSWRWTLTWLEGKPVIELDDGTVIRYNALEDSATITQPIASDEDEDDWI
ncbi:hypothetical protein GY21_08260 [Cryobacterium roopkundense]|uniref:Fe-S oxidoreductase n=1 Tax=Cryobacterium roopkundense TaxID=1001240 RepID=A0A099JGJ0_9MICO|nr:hypothetical protein [Cryobacterium roopkundense]KGJ77140.1 hypothetical protein GY21_08260 [Cryobacterium roopkundense]MBB5641488.1 hypothetical protein [Cryobacterium roopkundense]